MGKALGSDKIASSTPKPLDSNLCINVPMRTLSVFAEFFNSKRIFFKLCDLISVEVPRICEFFCIAYRA